jgi:undecaprenyl-diphosphatase
VSVQQIDATIFLTINGWVGHWPWLDGLMRILVNDYFMPVTMSLVLVALWFSGSSAAQRGGNQRAALYAIIAQVITNAMIATSNNLYYRQRPFIDHPAHLLFYRPTDSSFPANSVAVAFTFATAIWLTNHRLGAVLYAFAAIFAFARVFCGVHYPLDVLGGAAFGIVGGWLAVLLGRWLEPLLSRLIALARRLYLA